MQVSTCPTRDVLEAFVLGKLPDGDLQSIAEHADVCSACHAVLRALDDLADPLVARLRQPSSAAPDTSHATAVTVGPGKPAAARGAEPRFPFLAPPQAPDEIGRLAGFRVLSLLGQGGMGLVFLAVDEHLQRRVALKVVRPEFAGDADSQQRFLREVRAAAGLHSAHVVTVYQGGQDNGVLFLAMEHLQGESLETRLKRVGKLSVAEACAVARHMALGLADVHAQGLVHRDVKPDNVWLEGEPGATAGQVKLLDFGLARQSQADAHVTQTGVVAGTPAYMSPEQAKNEELDGRSDLFSLGSVLFRMLTGRQPFTGSSALAVLHALSTQQPALAPTDQPLPKRLGSLLLRLLAKNPADRPPSAQAVAEELAAIEGESSVALTLEPAVKGARPRRRSAVWLALAVGIGLGALILVRLPASPAEFAIETDDPHLEFRVDRQGGVVLRDKATDHTYRLKVGRADPATGTYEIDVSDPVAGLEFTTKTLTIKHGDKVALKAWLRPVKKEQPTVATVPPVPVEEPDPEAVWLKRVAALPPDNQIEEVRARLRELNPGFNGEFKVISDEQAVTSLVLPPEQVSNLTPLRVLTGLKTLECRGGTNSKLTDLRPLAGMPLRELNLWGNWRLRDLRPLAGMPLKVLKCFNTAVTDLTPLHGSQLESFDLGSGVTHLRPLKGVPLRRLQLNDCGDLRDLTGLEDVPLEFLSIANTKVTDLRALRGSSVKTLLMHLNTAIEDLTPLNGLQLVHLRADDRVLLANRAVVEQLTTLRVLNNKSPAAFWKSVDDRSGK